MAYTQAVGVSKGALWTGRVLSGLIIAFLAFDAVLKLVKPVPVVEAFNHLGLPMTEANTIGVLLGLSTLLYAIPQTSILGAILLTGYLGGAVQTHLRVGDPLASHELFPVYMGVVLWLALYLREPRLKALVPFRK